MSSPSAPAGRRPSGVEEPLAVALARLVGSGTLTAAQADAVRREVAVAPAAPAGPAAESRDLSWRAILSEVGGYVGAVFVLAAAVTVVGSAWDDLSATGRISLLLGPAVLLLGAAGAVAASAPGRWSARAAASARRRLVSALVTVSAALAGGATGVALESGGSEGSGRDAVLVAATVLAVVTPGYLFCRTMLLHLALAAAAVFAVVAVDSWAAGDGATDLTGLWIVLLGAGWAAASWWRVLSERVLGLVTAAVIAFIGGETLVVDGTEAGYAVLIGVAAAALAGYVLLREVALLVAGSVTLAIAVPQAVIDLSDGALGAAGALLVTGLSIVAASVLGLRLRRVAPEPS